MKRYFVWGVVLLSVFWTITHWGEFVDVKNRLDEMTFFAVAFIVTEACFNIGLVMLAASAGKSTLQALRQRSQILPALLAAVKDSKWGRLGFYLNWVGAFGATLVVLVGALWFLPGAAKALALVLGLDILSTFALRLPLWSKLHRVEDASSGRPRGNVVIRRAQPQDLEAYLEVQHAAWNGLSVDKERANQRFLQCREGILIAEFEGRVVGTAMMIRVDHYDFDKPLPWKVMTNDGWCTTHRPNGKLFFGVDLSVDRENAPQSTTDSLFVSAMQMVIRAGSKYCILGGRMPGFAEYAQHMTPEDYLWAKTEQGRYLDWEVQLYSKVPFMKVMGLIPEYFEDPASCNYGVLLRWRNPFYGLPAKRVWAKLIEVLLKLEHQVKAYKLTNKRKGRSEKDRPYSFSGHSKRLC